jgi:hypothetical protein
MRCHDAAGLEMMGAFLSHHAQCQGTGLKFVTRELLFFCTPVTKGALFFFRKKIGRRRRIRMALQVCCCRRRQRCCMCRCTPSIVHSSGNSWQAAVACCLPPVHVMCKHPRCWHPNHCNSASAGTQTTATVPIATRSMLHPLQQPPTSAPCIYTGGTGRVIGAEAILVAARCPPQ